MFTNISTLPNPSFSSPDKATNYRNTRLTAIPTTPTQGDPGTIRMSIENLKTFGESLSTEHASFAAGLLNTTAMVFCHVPECSKIPSFLRYISKSYRNACSGHVANILDQTDPFAEADEDTGETKQSQNYIHIRIQRKSKSSSPLFAWEAAQPRI